MPPQDGHATTVQGLADHLRVDAVEFWRIVQEEHGVMGQADLAGPGHGPAGGGFERVVFLEEELVVTQVDILVHRY